MPASFSWVIPASERGFPITSGMTFGASEALTIGVFFVMITQFLGNGIPSTYRVQTKNHNP